MSNPITWRTVTGPSLEAASRPMGQAAQSFNTGFDQLHKAIQNQQAANQNVFDNAQETQMLGIREALAGARTPEEALAMRDQLMQQREGLSAKNRGLLLSAEEDRATKLQDSYSKQVAYGHLKTDEEQAPTREEAIRLMATDPKAAQEYLAKNPQLRNGGKLALDALTQDRAALQHGWAEEDHKQKGVAFNYKKDHDKRLLDLEYAKLEAQRQERLNAAAARGAATLKDANGNIVDSLDALKKNSIAGMGYLGDTNYAKQMDALFTSRGIEGNYKQSAYSQVYEAFKDGTKIPTDDGKAISIKVPTAIIAKAISGADAPSGWFTFDSTPGKNVVEEVNRLLKDPEILKEAIAAEGLDPAIAQAHIDKIARTQYRQQIADERLAAQRARGLAQVPSNIGQQQGAQKKTLENQR